MRVSFIHLLTALGALASLANAYHDDYTFAARDYLDELTTLDRREILADFATRDLLAEVAARLEARDQGDSRPPFDPTRPIPPVRGRRPWSDPIMRGTKYNTYSTHVNSHK
ncbi:hypothetical protein DFP72DRAFT_1072688 [Ephemerocybe angulata]|uniref:Uncharacterized protein n=1 Tax=Ephemerocybe angulata TaxID=980116 RepID=A0A8H6HPP7_9AGAR|nr:hypothetical protein DFP72DRAFT_1072688 [Tulosesus angulatus]